MESLLIVPRESKIFKSCLLNGSVPIKYGSRMLSSWLDGRPVFGLIFTKLMPEGIRNGTLFILIFASFTKDLKIGVATEEPVCL